MADLPCIPEKPAKGPGGSGSKVPQENHPKASGLGSLEKLTKGYLMFGKIGGYYAKFADLSVNEPVNSRTRNGMAPSR